MRRVAPNFFAILNFPFRVNELADPQPLAPIAAHELL